MNKVLITGGTGAIGAALAAAFSKDCEVYFTYLNNCEKAEELFSLYGARGFRCDVSDSAQVSALAEKIGNIDILVNNAGISQIKMFTDLTDEDWNRMINVNLNSLFYVTKAFLPAMIRKKSGSIINISSMWGVSGAACEVHYSTAKAGIIGFTKALAKEVGPSGITSNCIAPGVIESRMNAHLSPEDLNTLTEETPLEKIGEPQDVAQAAVYLSKAGFVTGQILGVDGGYCI